MMKKLSSESARLVMFGFVVIVAMVRIEAAPRGSKQQPSQRQIAWRSTPTTSAVW